MSCRHAGLGKLYRCRTAEASFEFKPESFENSC